MINEIDNHEKNSIFKEIGNLFIFSDRCGAFPRHNISIFAKVIDEVSSVDVVESSGSLRGWIIFQVDDIEIVDSFPLYIIVFSNLLHYPFKACGMLQNWTVVGVRAAFCYNGEKSS